MRDLSLHLMDILRNCVDAGSSKVSIGLKADRDDDVLTITVDDDGRGIDPGIANCVKDPFVTTRKTRKVGLGLPLLADSARMSGGSLELVSKEKGTLVKALFSISHIDRPPLGDIGATVAGIIGAETDIRWILTFDNCNKIFSLDTDDIKKRTEGMDFSQPVIIAWIKDYVNEGLKFVFGGVLNEISC